MSLSPGVPSIFLLRLGSEIVSSLVRTPDEASSLKLRYNFETGFWVSTLDDSAENSSESETSCPSSALAKAGPAKKVLRLFARLTGRPLPWP